MVINRLAEDFMKKFLPVLVVLFSMAASAQAASSMKAPNGSVVLSPADAYVMMEEMVLIYERLEME